MTSHDAYAVDAVSSLFEAIDIIDGKDAMSGVLIASLTECISGILLDEDRRGLNAWIAMDSVRRYFGDAIRDGDYEEPDRLAIDAAMVAVLRLQESESGHLGRYG